MEQALYQATILTFEELGFMFPMPDDEISGLDPKTSSAISIDFDGEFEGQMVLQVESQMLPTIAENMLGEETALDEEIQRDALGEIANVICGNALPMIAGKKAVFKLRAPEFVEEFKKTAEPKAAARFSLDEGRAEVLLYVKGEQ
ncbi:MAG: chemotaxis protein CheX [Pyrinomonadaceae bacterium]